MMDAWSWSWRAYIFLFIVKPFENSHSICKCSSWWFMIFWILPQNMLEAILEFPISFVMALVSYCLKYHLKTRLKCALFCGLSMHFITLRQSFTRWLLTIWFNFFLAAIHDYFCIALDSKPQKTFALRFWAYKTILHDNLL